MTLRVRPDGGNFIVDDETGLVVGMKQPDGRELFFPFVTSQPSSFPASVAGGATGIATWDSLNIIGTTIASVAGVTDIGAADAPHVIVSGTEVITGLGTKAAGAYREVKFSGACTLTHHATDLILPGAANIVTAANDVAAFRSLGTGKWICEWYKRQSGLLLGTANSSQVVGTTTNDNAAAGCIGEVISSAVASGSAVALTSTVAVDITSISLTAGDWDVWGQVGFLPAATTSITDRQGAISATSATIPAGELVANARFGITSAAVVPGANVQVYPLAPARISLAGTTTIYLIGRATFTVDTLGGFGKIVARRAR